MLYTLKEHEGKKLFTNEHLEERATVSSQLKPEQIQTLEESAKDKNARKLIVKMEAIHVGKTRNSTFYTEEGLKGGLKSWTQPYNKPVLTHHNAHDGEPIGRILEAQYSDQTLSGKSGLIFTVEITDPTAVEKVLDGRYHTVSIGASTDKVTCNICGTDRTEEWCEHYPGRRYDEQDCHFIIGNTYGREVSYVNTPSDENAGNRSVEIVDPGSDKTNESVNAKIYQMAEGLYQDVENPEVNLYEHLNEDVKKLIDSMANVKEGSEEELPPVEEKNKNQVEEQKGSEKELEEKTKTPVDEKENPTPEGKEKEINETELSPEELTEKVRDLQASVSNLVLENQKLQSSLVTAEAENNRLVKENATLIEAAHLSLAEKVVDLKLSLNKADVIGTDREEAVQAHVSRTKESLEDSLKDLLSESQKKPMPEAGSVKNPGLEHNEDENKDKSISINEAVSLMTNMFNRKK